MVDSTIPSIFIMDCLGPQRKPTIFNGAKSSHLALVEHKLNDFYQVGSSIGRHTIANEQPMLYLPLHLGHGLHW